MPAGFAWQMQVSDASMEFGMQRVSRSPGSVLCESELQCGLNIPVYRQFVFSVCFCLLSIVACSPWHEVTVSLGKLHAPCLNRMLGRITHARIVVMSTSRLCHSFKATGQLGQHTSAFTQQIWVAALQILCSSLAISEGLQQRVHNHGS